MWLGSLDDTAHAKGVGSPDTIAALRALDAQIRRVEDGLRKASLFDSYDIWVTSDHGFSTHTGGADINAILAPFAGTMPDGSPRIVASGGAIYVRNGDERAIAGIVAALQREPKIGAIFTRPEAANSFLGHVPGTLSFNVSRSNHERGPQILYSPSWTNDRNAFGMPGTVASGGVAGHGSASPWDVHNTLIAAGPDLKSGVTIASPSANVDLAPTFLDLLNVRPPATAEGRSLDEAFAKSRTAPVVKSSEATAKTGDGAYAVTATLSVATANGREYRYFDKAIAVRK
jgi:arylsulfatase A-like enzyme